MGKLFYGTQTGTTRHVALQIQQHLKGLICEVKCIDTVIPDDLSSCDFLVLGGATYGDGELTDDWKRFWPQMDSIDFSHKKIALFALGDQVGYTYTFVGGMRQLYDNVRERSGEIIAHTVPTDAFQFDHSESIVDGFFVGLVVDEVNQPNLTEKRIKAWASQVREELMVACPL